MRTRVVRQSTRGLFLQSKQAKTTQKKKKQSNLLPGEYTRTMMMIGVAAACSLFSFYFQSYVASSGAAFVHTKSCNGRRSGNAFLGPFSIQQGVSKMDSVSPTVAQRKHIGEMWREKRDTFRSAYRFGTVNDDGSDRDERWLVSTELRNGKSSPITSQKADIRSSTSIENRVTYAQGNAYGMMGRRRWLRDLIVSSTATSVSAYAADSPSFLSAAYVTPALTRSATVKSALCDPTIESYRKGPKQIHIVGTAHVSSVSAQLTASVVRDIKVRR